MKGKGYLENVTRNIFNIKKTLFEENWDKNISETMNINKKFLIWERGWQLLETERLLRLAYSERKSGGR